jgi:hypothetical protein
MAQTTATNHVYSEVCEERKRQDMLWGQRFDDLHNTGSDWLVLIGDQIEQINDPPSFRERLVKIAALAIAACESYDRINGEAS